MKLLDERKLAFDLPAGFFIVRTEAMERAFLSALAEKRCHRLSIIDGILRKFVAEIFQGELKPPGKLDRVDGRGGQVVKKPRHLCGCFQMTL